MNMKSFEELDEALAFIRNFDIQRGQEVSLMLTLVYTYIVRWES